ncbi:MAG: hypothetical protein HOC53_03130 [Candidatus Nitrosopelagicus sp.]|jgi:hypothetical protein|nr:hypothetical protein [Candidatus Nitrosopelagicus sp.]MBT3761421.1 hypothetical protein [Candidatus Nitrosopelagicus sp.]MBT4454928.1 hypothetical protein [Candidatus Nitrosopelagicus sp.]
MIKSTLLLGILFSSILIMPFASAQQFEKATFQESASIIYDQKISGSIITSIGFETTSNEEIRFPGELIEKINANEKIRAVVFTNAGECVIGVTSEQQCIMINFDYEKLKGDGGIRMVQESAREMGGLLIDDLNQVFRTDAEFHSVYIHTADNANVLLETSGIVSGKGAVSATYVTDKRATDFLFTDIAGILIPKEIRDGGGFYDIAKKLSIHDDSIISVTMIPNEDSNLYMFKITKEIKEKSNNITVIRTLESFEVDKISRTDYFDNRNVPLNSIIQLIIIPSETTKVNAISTHAITDVTTFENIMKKGWFLSSPAGEMIDLKFLFGQSKTISAEELLVETAPWDMQSEMTLYSVEKIESEAEEVPIIENEEEGSDETQYAVLGIIIVAGIGAAIFYLKGYKPKH